MDSNAAREVTQVEQETEASLLLFSFREHSFDIQIFSVTRECRGIKLAELKLNDAALSFNRS